LRNLIYVLWTERADHILDKLLFSKRPVAFDDPRSEVVLVPIATLFRATVVPHVLAGNTKPHWRHLFHGFLQQTSVVDSPHQNAILLFTRTRICINRVNARFFFREQDHFIRINPRLSEYVTKHTSGVHLFRGFRAATDGSTPASLIKLESCS
jgi:hypothetical protein